MKAADRKLALKAARLQTRGLMLHAVARKLKLEEPRAQVVMNIGLLLEQCEAHRLTDNEMLVMKTLARIEARRVEHGHAVAKANQVDFAAGRRSGWCWSVVNKRLTFNPHFVVYTPASSGHIWLTPAGWAFVWATGLILKNWKVPG